VTPEVALGCQFRLICEADAGLADNPDGAAGVGVVCAGVVALAAFDAVDVPVLETATTV
jgi:hypothetical protein